jgi:hypothetical protein
MGAEEFRDKDDRKHKTPIPLRKAAGGRLGFIEGRINDKKIGRLNSWTSTDRN